MNRELVLSVLIQAVTAQRVLLGIFGALGVGCASSLLQPTSARAETDKPIAACVEHRAEARYSGVGYNHLVHIHNKCERAVTCAVHTNVNPESIRVRVAPRAVETVLTWRGSPAREFKASVTCQWSE